MPVTNTTEVFFAEIGEHASTLFDGCDTLTTYLSNLKKVAETDEPTGKVQDRVSRVQAHGFETLVNVVIDHFGLIKDYESISSDFHLRLHGKGVNEDGNRCAVGIFHTDYEQLIGNVHKVPNFLGQAWTHCVDWSKSTHPNTYFIFSNALEWHPQSYKNWVEKLHLQDAVTSFFYNDIALLIDKNPKFWSKFAKFWHEFKAALKSGDPEIKVLRPYQNDAVQFLLQQDTAKVFLPMGTGKTLIQAALIYEEIKANPNAVCMICSPRILLSMQIMREIFQFLAQRGVAPHFLSLHSGDNDYSDLKQYARECNIPVRDIPKTTSAKGIDRAYRRALMDGQPLVIAATYQSGMKILETEAGGTPDNPLPIQLASLLCDEAHNLVESIGRLPHDARRAIHTIPAKRKSFYTATPPFSKTTSGIGMNNPDLYGFAEFEITPLEMIRQQQILMPRKTDVHLNSINIGGKKKHATITTARQLERNPEVVARMIVDTFLQHRTDVKNDSARPNDIGAKMLVALKNERSFRGTLVSRTLANFRRNNPHVKIYGVSSRSGMFANGEWRRGKSPELLKEICKLSTQDDAIIVHIDMISEGLDVPDLTGFFPLRMGSKTTATQGLGRTMRVNKEDRRIITLEGSIDPHKMLKPYGWLLLPVFGNKQLDAEIQHQWKEILEEIRVLNKTVSQEPHPVDRGEGKDVPLKPTTNINYPSPDGAAYTYVYEDWNRSVLVRLLNLRDDEVLDRLSQIARETFNAIGTRIVQRKSTKKSTKKKAPRSPRK